MAKNNRTHYISLPIIDRYPIVAKKVMFNNMFVAFTVNGGKITILPPERFILSEDFMKTVEITPLGVDNFLREGYTLADTGRPIFGNFNANSVKSEDSPEYTTFILENTEFNLVNYLVEKPNEDFYIAVLDLHVGVDIVEGEQVSEDGKPMIGVNMDFNNLQIQASVQNLYHNNKNTLEIFKSFEFPKDMDELDIEKVPENFKDMAELGLKIYFSPEDSEIYKDIVDLYHLYVSGRMASEELYRDHGLKPASDN